MIQKPGGHNFTKVGLEGSGNGRPIAWATEETVLDNEVEHFFGLLLCYYVEGDSVFFFFFFFFF